MQEIAGASRQQASGISQVDRAIGELDQVTQENARMSEMSAHSACRMSGNADILHRTLEVFRMR